MAAVGNGDKKYRFESQWQAGQCLVGKLNSVVRHLRYSFTYGSSQKFLIYDHSSMKP